MEVCLEEELPPTTELEEGLRNGVYLAKLAKFFAPNVVSDKKIYDVEQARYKVKTFSVLTIKTKKKKEKKHLSSALEGALKHNWLIFCVSFIRLSGLDRRHRALRRQHDKLGFTLKKKKLYKCHLMFLNLNKLHSCLQGEYELYCLNNYFSLGLRAKSSSVIKLDNYSKFSSSCMGGHSCH